MKWLERLTKCVDYIEDNIEDIDIEELCSIACLSRIYFSRLFDAVTGMTLGEYIRRRRMTLAAGELLRSDIKVIDIAIKYGYSSSEAFSRAFKSIHDVSPSYVRTNRPKLKSYPKITFNITIKGDVDMNYKVVEKDAFKVLGRSIITTEENGKNNTEIPQFWYELYTTGVIDKMLEVSGSDTKYGICLAPIKEHGKEFEYLIAVPYNGGDKADMKVYDIPKTDWAVFECRGSMPDAIQKVWNRIFSEWLPATKYEINTELPDIEYYSPGDNDQPDYYSEIWLPVKLTK